MSCLRPVTFVLVLGGAFGCGGQPDAGGGASGKNIKIPGPGYKADDVEEGINSPDDDGMEPVGGRPLGAQDLLCTGTPFEKQLFPGDTNTMVAAQSARQFLSEGRSPLPSTVRAQDFFNYYGMDLAASEAPSDKPLLAIGGIPRSAPGRWDIAVGIQALPVANDQRKPLVLTVVVDLTPAMWGLGLTRVQESLAAIAGNLRAGDSVQLLTTRPDDVVQSFQIQGTNDPGLSAAANALAIDNDGSLVTALESGYVVARQQVNPSADNRVLVLSAGDASEDLVPADLIASAASQDRIFLVAGATGSSYGEYQRFLASASRLGRGPYVSLGMEGSAEELFGKRFSELFGYGIDNIALKLTLPGHARLLADSPSAPTNVSSEKVGQYIGPGASQLFLFRITTCAQPPATDVVSVELTFTAQDGKPDSVNDEFLFSNSGGTHPVYAKTAAIAAYIEALRSMDKMRIGFAKQAISDAQASVVSADDHAELTSMDQLLDLHPAK